jgi:hypothetical protein
MATREPDRPLQRSGIARDRSASLPLSYTTSRETTPTRVVMGFSISESRAYRARKHEHFPLRVPESTNISRFACPKARTSIRTQDLAMVKQSVRSMP